MEAAVARTGRWELQIVRRCDRHRFVVLPKRWIPGSSPRTERTLAWISRNRRLARDYERHARKAAAFVRLAMIRIMLRHVAPSRRSGIQTSRIGSKQPIRTSCVDGSRVARGSVRVWRAGRVQSCVRPHMMVSSSRLGRAAVSEGLSCCRTLPANLTSGGTVLSLPLSPMRDRRAPGNGTTLYRRPRRAMPNNGDVPQTTGRPHRRSPGPLRP
jgi:hypothetical protein